MTIIIFLNINAFHVQCSKFMNINFHSIIIVIGTYSRCWSWTWYQTQVCRCNNYIKHYYQIFIYLKYLFIINRLLNVTQLKIMSNKYLTGRGIMNQSTIILRVFLISFVYSFWTYVNKSDRLHFTRAQVNHR